MNYIYAGLLLLLFPIIGYPQNEVAKRIIIIGNAGKNQNIHFSEAVRNNIVFDANTTVLYIGNNARPYDSIALQKECSIVARTDAQVIFVPGYGDWANGKRNGYEAVLQQQRFIERMNNERIKFYPANACP